MTVQMPEAMKQERDRLIRSLQQAESDVVSSANEVNILIHQRLNTAIKQYNQLLHEVRLLKDRVIRQPPPITWMIDWFGMTFYDMTEISMIELPELTDASDLADLPMSDQDTKS